MSEILEKNELIDTRYRVERFIGAGGMGAVYRVRDVRKGGQVIALKMLSPSASDGHSFQRFRREFYTLSRLSHPNLVTVFESGAHGRFPYFTMEYLSGWTLEKALSSPRSSLCAALRHQVPALMAVLSQVCSALGYIHALGVVHRDLKPSNLMLSKPDSGALRVKLMDMGLATSREEIDLAEERGLTGTVHYMSPEQVRGTGIDQRSDLYALGVILYEILTGRLPFDGESPATVALKHIREVPVPLRQHRSDIPAILQQIVLTLLEKEPVSRYPSAEELLSSLSALGGPDLVAEKRSFKGPPLLLRPRFVGRAEELAVLRRLLAEASEGRGRLVVLSGEAGIGKTALLDEVRAQARLSGFYVLSGAGRGPSQAPLHPLVEALRGWLRGSKVTRSLSPEVRAQVARLLPELASRESVSRASNGAAELFSGEEGQRLLSALVQLFSEQARHRSVALFLEDLHEADEQTLAFLAQLTEALGDIPMVACVSFRTGETEDTPISTLLRDAERQGIVHLNLPRLAHTEVVQLVASMLGGYDVPEPVGRWLFERTEGNPLFAAETVKALVESRAIFRDGGTWTYLEERKVEVPETVQQVIRRRLAGLDAGTSEILAYGAVIGKSFEFDILMAACPREEMVLVDALERLRRAQVVREEVAKTTYSFTHAMLQEVVYEGIPRERRKQFHLKVAEAIEQLQAGRVEQVAEVLAHHFSEAREVEKAIPYLKEAGDRAGELYALSSAIVFYERALRLIQVNRLTYYIEGGGLPFYLDILCNYAYVLSSTGRWEEAIKSANLVLDLTATEDISHQRAKSLMVLSGIYWNQGERNKAIQVVRKTQKLYSKLADQEGEAFSLQLLSVHYWFHRRYKQALCCGIQASEKYRSIGGKLNQIKALQVLASSCSMRGDLLSVRRHHQKALAICDEICDESCRYLSIGPLRQIFLLRGEFHLAKKYALVEADFFRKSGSKRRIAENLINLGDIYLEGGELAKAEKQYSDALEILLSLQERYKSCLAYCRLSEIALRKNDLTKAVEYVQQGV